MAKAKFAAEHRVGVPIRDGKPLGVDAANHAGSTLRAMSRATDAPTRAVASGLESSASSRDAFASEAIFLGRSTSSSTVGSVSVMYSPSLYQAVPVSSLTTEKPEFRCRRGYDGRGQHRDRCLLRRLHNQLVNFLGLENPGSGRGEKCHVVIPGESDPAHRSVRCVICARETGRSRCPPGTFVSAGRPWAGDRVTCITFSENAALRSSQCADLRRRAQTIALR
jgi:hypothetical protein